MFACVYENWETKREKKKTFENSWKKVKNGIEWINKNAEQVENGKKWKTYIEKMQKKWNKTTVPILLV